MFCLIAYKWDTNLPIFFPHSYIGWKVTMHLCQLNEKYFTNNFGSATFNIGYYGIQTNHCGKEKRLKISEQAPFMLGITGLEHSIVGRKEK